MRLDRHAVKGGLRVIVEALRRLGTLPPPLAAPLPPPRPAALPPLAAPPPPPADCWAAPLQHHFATLMTK